MEKLKLHSSNQTDENIARIRELFPNCVTEAKDEQGAVRHVVDFDQLRQELSDHVVEGPQERYQMNWPGKRAALVSANAPIAKTLRPYRAESVNFDNTKNLFIEGDNLDALKLLQETYLGKIKLIYIDPPYNTGNDFVYRDQFAETSDDFLTRSNQQDAEGNRLVANKESSGRFHSDWLSMIYPRIKLSRNLLRDDGVILISIDDAEVSNLKAICSEIFGEQNFVASLIWERGRKNDAKLVSVGHEYMLMFVKNKNYLQEQKTKWRESKPGAKEILSEYLRLRALHGDNVAAIENGIREFYEALPKAHPSKKHARYNKVDQKGVWRDDNMSWPGGSGPNYDVLHPVTGMPCAVPEGGWRYSTPEKMQQMISLGKVVFRETHSEPPIRKTYLLEVGAESPVDDEDVDDEVDSEDLPIQVAGSYFYRSALQASNELNLLFGAKVFNNPKDKDVLARWISYVNASGDDIVLDFFAGSATTAHAVMELNAREGSALRFIMVQLPEPINPKAKGAKAAVSFLEKLGRPIVISELTKERIRRAGKVLLGNGDLGTWQKDIGFRVLKVDTSNMADVYYKPNGAKQDDLLGQIDNVKPGRGDPDDLLLQVLVDWGVDLTLPIRKETVKGKLVFFVNTEPYDLIACFDRGVSEELVKELAKYKPVRIVFRDNGFESDAVKINVDQIFRQLSPSTDVKAI